MATIIEKKEIESLLKDLDVVSEMEKGFIDYSNGKTVVPPVAELLFDDPRGETHIKYGYTRGQDYFVIKIASGFYENAALGLSSSQGMMLLFSQKTGQTKGVLLDDGFLTDVRTAAAGAVAARYFAPKKIKAIGVVGAGIQARLQLEYIQKHNPCKKVWIWARNQESAQRFKAEFAHDLSIRIAETTAQLATECNVIVTTTPAENALLKAEDINKGTHITAVGSDTPQKQELESDILRKADIVIADSIPQSKSRGEVFRAVRDNKIAQEKVIELGSAIQNPELYRKNDDQISVVDLTGVAVQDIMIAQAIYNSRTNNKK